MNMLKRWNDGKIKSHILQSLYVYRTGCSYCIIEYMILMRLVIVWCVRVSQPMDFEWVCALSFSKAQFCVISLFLFQCRSNQTSKSTFERNKKLPHIDGHLSGSRDSSALNHHLWYRLITRTLSKNIAAWWKTREYWRRQSEVFLVHIVKLSILLEHIPMEPKIGSSDLDQNIGFANHRDNWWYLTVLLTASPWHNVWQRAYFPRR